MIIPSSFTALVAHKAAVLGITAVIGTGTTAVTVAAIVQTRDAEQIVAEEPSPTVTTEERGDDTTTTTAASTTSTTTDTATTDDSTSSTDENDTDHDWVLESDLVSCEDAVNHGEYVSSRARTKAESDDSGDDADEPGSPSMREAAQSDCGKPDPSVESADGSSDGGDHHDDGRSEAEDGEDSEAEDGEDGEDGDDSEAEDGDDSEAEDDDASESEADDSDDSGKSNSGRGKSDERGPKDKSGR